MKHYRDLTGDDVLRAGDIQPSSTTRFGWEPVSAIGMKACEVYPYTFRRPITPAEITAAERVKFEAWVKEHSVTTDMIQRDQGGGYAIILAHWSWKAWCAAVGCDPMADRTTD